MSPTMASSQADGKEPSLVLVSGCGWSRTCLPVPDHQEGYKEGGRDAGSVSSGVCQWGLGRWFPLQHPVQSFQALVLGRGVPRHRAQRGLGALQSKRMDYRMPS